MTQYYYLVASLPMLMADGPPPLDSPALLRLCHEHVVAADFALLSRITLAELDVRPGDPGVWRDYSGWETALRNELARQRAQRLGLDPEPFLRPAPFRAGLPLVVKEALASGSPLASETALDRRRWSCLEELETGTQFGLDRLIVYRLKLLLLERRSRWRPEPGRKAFAAEYARILINTEY